MLLAFRRAAQGILNQLGEDAFFNGATTPIKINIEQGVQVEGFLNDTDKDVFIQRDVATLIRELKDSARVQFDKLAAQYPTSVTVAFAVQEGPVTPTIRQYIADHAIDLGRAGLPAGGRPSAR